MKRTAMVLVAALALLALSPSGAWAGEVTTRVVSRVTGMEIATQILSQVRSVEIGSSSATVTVEADGEVREIGVSAGELSDDGSSAGGPIGAGATSGITKLMAVPFLLGGAVRVLRFLSKLAAM